MLLNDLRKKYKKDILALSQKHQIKNVKVFGSVATGNANEKSDIDLLVDLEKNADLMDLGGFQYDVSQLIPNHKIDVLTEDRIHWYIKDKILDEAQEL